MMLQIPDLLFLTPNGRVGRMIFWIFGVVPLCVVLAGAWLVDQSWNLRGGPYWVSLLLWAFPFTVVLIKRWHDRDRPAYFALIVLIPLGGQVWTLIECGFLPGIDTSNGMNRFGNNPMIGKPRVVSVEEIEMIENVRPGQKFERKDGTEVIRRPAPDEKALKFLFEIDEGGIEPRAYEVIMNDPHHEKQVIGRKSDCNWVIKNSSVSRHHAELFLEHGFLMIRDLGSTSGTRINGVSVDDRAGLKLSDRDLLELGEIRINVREG